MMNSERVWADFHDFQVLTTRDIGWLDDLDCSVKSSSSLGDAVKTEDPLFLI